MSYAEETLDFSEMQCREGGSLAPKPMDSYPGLAPAQQAGDLSCL